MVIVVCLVLKNKYWQPPLFLTAALVGYSRIYLGHHYVQDVLAGAVLGTLVGIGTYFIFSKSKAQQPYLRRAHKNSVIH